MYVCIYKYIKYAKNRVSLQCDDTLLLYNILSVKYRYAFISSMYNIVII